MRRKATIEEYREWAEELKELSDQLSILNIEIGKKFGKSFGKPLLHGHNNVLKIRADLDDRFAQDFPEEFDETVFYP